MFEFPYEKFEEGPIIIYRILNLKEGEFLNGMYFTKREAAEGYLKNHINAQWEAYKKMLIECRLHGFTNQMSLSYQTEDVIFTYKGQIIKPPTDREYMYDIIEV